MRRNMVQKQGMKKPSKNGNNYAKKTGAIRRRLNKTLISDRVDLSRKLRRIENLIRKNPENQKIAARIEKIERQLEASIALREKRMSLRPKEISCDLSLPISAKKDEIISAVRAHSVVIVSGATGSGKTTQIPKFCLQAGRGISGRIACTQPRRIAAVTVAERIAEELGCAPGTLSGYKIRFKDRVSDETIIKTVTDGILLAETRSDRHLNEYDTIIVDEAHERSLNIDFLLGLLKRILKRRRDLKLVITSATIDTEKFSRAFDNAPVIEVSGRMYPVEIIYSPPETDEDDKSEATYVESAVMAVDRLVSERKKGDILVFMPTQRDILEACDMLEGRRYKNTKVLPLYARLPAARQKRVFEKGTFRKIIVATNVAETSITIPGIKYVVDTGLARISRYVPKTRTTTLPVVPISKSSADQRAGRCGRVQNGVCIRLYAEEDFLTRPEFTPPEILRANLAEVVLRMMALGLGDIKSFEFVDPPPAARIGSAYDTLLELGAIRPKDPKKGKASGFILTRTGRLMARLPLDPRLSRMLIEAEMTGCLPEITAITAALTIPDPRYTDDDDRDAAEKAHAAFVDPRSDFITLYNLWQACTANTGQGRNGETFVRAKDLKNFSKTHHVSFKRMREWIDIHDQIAGIMSEADIRAPGKTAQKKDRPSAAATGKFSATPEKSDKKDFTARYTAIHRAVLSGLISSIAVKKEKNIYMAAHNREVMLFPGSSLFNQGGQWIVAAEIVETSRLFARIAANISPDWIEPVARGLCTYTHTNPRWDKKLQAVVADERVTLYGLTIIDKRTVHFGKADPEKAAEIFIRSALIKGEITGSFPFLSANRALMEKIGEMEDRVRRRGILADEDTILEFYKKRLGTVSDTRALCRLIRKSGGDDFLKMTEADLVENMPDTGELDLFPDHIRLGEREWKCRYRFNPGGRDDGVTLLVPAQAAADLPVDTADWVVPGLMAEKITAMIRKLPKNYRKRLVPVNETVSKIMSGMPMYRGSLAASLSDFIRKRFNVDIPESVWTDEGLPDYLRPRFAIMDPNGNEIRCGRDPRILGQAHEAVPEKSSALAEAREKWETGPAGTWTFPDIPETIFINAQENGKIAVYPHLVAMEHGSALRLSADRNHAEKNHVKGVSRLYAEYFRKEFAQLKKFVKSRILKTGKACAHFFGGPDRVAEHVASKVQSVLFEKNIRTRKAFERLAKDCVNQILQKGLDLFDAVLPVIEAYAGTASDIGRICSRHAGQKALISFLKGLEDEMKRLVPENFINLYDQDRMPDIARYLRAISIRAQRGIIDPEKDREKELCIEIHVRRLKELIRGIDEISSKAKKDGIEEFFWMIEEFKVSLFAQELGTRIRVSEKRLTQKYQELVRMI